jgi:predicted  nucleic acid-binding Zn-ribbon protein
MLHGARRRDLLNNQKSVERLQKEHSALVTKLESDYRKDLTKMENHHNKSMAQLVKKMDAADNTFDKQKSEWQNKICHLESALDKMRDSYHGVKARRRHQATAEELKRSKLEDEIHELNEWILELDSAREAAEAETHKAKKDAHQVKKKYIRAKDDAYSRLIKLRNETLARRAKEDELTRLSKALGRSETDLGILSQTEAHLGHTAGKQTHNEKGMG